MSVCVGGITHATQGAADYLLAQQLRTECPDTQYVGNCIGIPSFRKHRNRHDGAYFAAESAPLTDRVHDLPQELLVG